MRAALLAAALAGLALPPLSGCALARKYQEPLAEDAELIRARTDDGWELALIHYRARGERSGPPVLLCHGISANARNLDLDEGHSLARYLAARGRDTFALSLRGNGDSDRADPERGRSGDYSMDTYASHDIPAALAAIRKRTGAGRVDYVGHSMGGLIGYIYLARGGEGFNSFVALGSPARFNMGSRLERTLARVGVRLRGRIELLDVPLLAAMLTPMHGEVRTLVDELLYNPDNVSGPLWKKLVATGLGTISGAVLNQFALWLEREAMVSADGTIDYLAALGQVKVPALVVAGKLDRLAPASCVKAGYQALGGEKTFFVAGEENGFRHDYGHMDLIIGDRAPVELWPRLLAFLQAHRP